jgi:hypothetical protein
MEGQMTLQLTHRDRYEAELRSANKVITDADALIPDPDDPSWFGVDESKLNPDFLRYYRGLQLAGYANGFI